eukprot:m.238398 g.238398  ORF g.238398 m.238398 type:complete len:271 (-) comp33722_c1_seq1:154-966(-)
MAKRLWGLYNKYLESDPFKTKATICLSLTLAADINAQWMQYAKRKRESMPIVETNSITHTVGGTTGVTTASTGGSVPHTGNGAHVGAVNVKDIPDFALDLKRQTAIASYSLMYQAPFGHWWFGFLDRQTRRFVPPAWSVPTKVVMDQLVDATLGTSLYMSFVPWMEGHGDIDWVFHKMRLDFVPTYVVDCAFWPIVMALNFKYIPIKHQLLVANLAVFCWQTFMSYVCHDDSILRRLDKYNPFANAEQIEEDMLYLKMAKANRDAVKQEA